MDILIKNAQVICNDDLDTVYHDGYVAIKDGIIDKVGSKVDLQEEELKGLEQQAKLVLNAEGYVLIPGLINTHTHFFQTFLRGAGEGNALYDWLKKIIWPFAINMTEEDMYFAAMLGCLESLKGGVTSIIDNHYVNTSVYNSDRVIEAMGDSGIRGVLARGYTNKYYHPDFIEEEDIIFSELERLINKTTNSYNSRVSVVPGPLSPVRCTPELFKRTGEFAKANNLSIHIHVAETETVRNETIEWYGKSNVIFLNDLGMLYSKTQLVHSVWIDDEEKDIIKDAGASIVHCPISNMYLGSGIPPITAYKERNINVALASDGPASNDTHDMFETMKATVCLQRVANVDAGCISAKDAFKMATIGGANALGDDKVGRIVPGMKADIVMLDLNKPHIKPSHNLSAALVYNTRCTDVKTVIVDGKPLILNGRVLFIDETVLLQECMKRVKKIAKKIGLSSSG